MAETRAKNKADDANVPGLKRNMYWSSRDRSIRSPAKTYSCNRGTAGQQIVGPPKVSNGVGIKASGSRYFLGGTRCCRMKT